MVRGKSFQMIHKSRDLMGFADQMIFKDFPTLINRLTILRLQKQNIPAKSYSVIIFGIFDQSNYSRSWLKEITKK